MHGYKIRFVLNRINNYVMEKSVSFWSCDDKVRPRSETASFGSDLLRMHCTLSGELLLTSFWRCKIVSSKRRRAAQMGNYLLAWSVLTLCQVLACTQFICVPTQSFPPSQLLCFLLTSDFKCSLLVTRLYSNSCSPVIFFSFLSSVCKSSSIYLLSAVEVCSTVFQPVLVLGELFTLGYY